MLYIFIQFKRSFFYRAFLWNSTNITPQIQTFGKKSRVYRASNCFWNSVHKIGKNIILSCISNWWCDLTPLQFLKAEFCQTILDSLDTSLHTYVPKQTNSSSSATNVLINFPREIKRPAKRIWSETIGVQRAICKNSFDSCIIRVLHALYIIRRHYGYDNCCVYDKFYYSG